MTTKPKGSGLASFASPSRAVAPQPQPEPEVKLEQPAVKSVDRGGRPRSAPAGDLVPLTTRLREDQRRALRQIALDTDQTVQTLVMTAIADHVQKLGGKWPS